jgi:hypothetical protein
LQRALANYGNWDGRAMASYLQLEEQAAKQIEEDFKQIGNADFLAYSLEEDGQSYLVRTNSLSVFPIETENEPLPAGLYISLELAQKLQISLGERLELYEKTKENNTLKYTVAGFYTSQNTLQGSNHALYFYDPDFQEGSYIYFSFLDDINGELYASTYPQLMEYNTMLLEAKWPQSSTFSKVYIIFQILLVILAFGLVFVFSLLFIKKERDFIQQLYSLGLRKSKGLFYVFAQIVCLLLAAFAISAALLYGLGWIFNALPLASWLHAAGSVQLEFSFLEIARNAAIIFVLFLAAAFLALVFGGIFSMKKRKHHRLLPLPFFCSAKEVIWRDFFRYAHPLLFSGLVFLCFSIFLGGTSLIAKWKESFSSFYSYEWDVVETFNLFTPDMAYSFLERNEQIVSDLEHEMQISLNCKAIQENRDIQVQVLDEKQAQSLASALKIDPSAFGSVLIGGMKQAVELTSLNEFDQTGNVILYEPDLYIEADSAPVLYVSIAQACDIFGLFENGYMEGSLNASAHDPAALTAALEENRAGLGDSVNVFSYAAYASELKRVEAGMKIFVYGFGILLALSIGISMYLLFVQFLDMRLHQTKLLLSLGVSMEYMSISYGLQFALIVLLGATVSFLVCAKLIGYIYIGAQISFPAFAIFLLLVFSTFLFSLGFFSWAKKQLA